MTDGPATARGMLTALVVEQLGRTFKRLWPVEYTKKFTELLADIDLVEEFCRERDRMKIPTV
jgi:hypothetical protein